MKNLKDEAYKIRMTPAEKQAMHLALFPVSAPSPYFVFNFQFLRVHSFATLCLVLVVLVGGSTAAAAEGALPGDVLYTVKINVNEALAQGLSVSPKARADLHATLAERRLVEAQELAAKGRLGAVVSEELATSLESHVEAAEVAADEAEAVDAGKGREVRAKLAAALDANARVLARHGGERDDDTRTNSQGLAVRVLAHSAGSGQARAALKQSTAADTAVESMSLSLVEVHVEGVEGQRAAASLEERAAEALRDARATFAQLEGSLSTTTTADIERELSSIETSMSLGSASLGAGATEQAGNDFATAIKLATKLKALLDAHKKFDGNLITPLLRNNDEHEGEDINEHRVDVQVEILRPL